MQKSLMKRSKQPFSPWVVGRLLGPYCLPAMFIKVNGTELGFPYTIGSSLSSLIPKVDQPENFNQFEPINLCIIIYKVLIKIVAFRLKRVIGKLVGTA